MVVAQTTNVVEMMRCPWRRRMHMKVEPPRGVIERLCQLLKDGDDTYQVRGGKD